MNEGAKRTLAKAGWKIGNASEFLGLSAEEEAYVELKLSLSKAISDRRRQLHLTQTQVASRIGSGQSRVAKMEKAEASTSLDYMVRSMLALGATRKEVVKAMS
jgi:predicted XRE-type DNA-binding protein